MTQPVICTTILDENIVDVTRVHDNQYVILSSGESTVLRTYNPRMRIYVQEVLPISHATSIVGCSYSYRFFIRTTSTLYIYETPCIFLTSVPIEGNGLYRSNNYFLLTICDNGQINQYSTDGILCLSIPTNIDFNPVKVVQLEERLYAIIHAEGIAVVDSTGTIVARLKCQPVDMEADRVRRQIFFVQDLKVIVTDFDLKSESELFLPKCFSKIKALSYDSFSDNLVIGACNLF